MNTEEKIKLTIKTYDEIAEVYEKLYSDVKRNKENRDFFIESLKKTTIQKETKEKKTFSNENYKIKLLDLGCGHGRDTKIFLNENFNVYSFDASQKFIDKIKNNYPSAHAIKGDFRNLPFEKDFFDGIWASASLLHAPKKDLNSILKQTYSILKPNGVFYASFQLGEGEFLKEKFYSNKVKKRFFSLYKAEELTELFEKNNFLIEKTIIDEYDSKWYSIFARKQKYKTQ